MTFRHCSRLVLASCGRPKAHSAARFSNRFPVLNIRYAYRTFRGNRDHIQSDQQGEQYYRGFLTCTFILDRYEFINNCGLWNFWILGVSRSRIQSAPIFNSQHNWSFKLTLRSIESDFWAYLAVEESSLASNPPRAYNRIARTGHLVRRCIPALSLEPH